MSKEIRAKAVDIVTDAPAVVNVEIRPKNRFELTLMKWGILPKKRTFRITGSTLGTMARISSVLLGLKQFREDANILSFGLNHMAENAERVAYVIALAIHNKRTEPPKELVEFLMNNLDGADFNIVLGVVLEKLNLRPFTSTIALIENLNILSEASPADEVEKIAPQKQTSVSLSDLPESIFAGAEITSSGV